MAEPEKGRRVCVTGAGGFVASWLVNLLLSKNYTVHGTVRDPEDKKYGHLLKLEKASKNLKLCKADLLDYESLRVAIQGCDGVFHVASPVPASVSLNPDVELMQPAVNGTLNVLKACHEAKVRRLVYVSSVVAATMNPSWEKGRTIDETCWSDKEYCAKTQNWYCLSKTEAESQAWEFAKRSGLDMVSVLPSLVIGPCLQPTINASSRVLLNIIRDGCPSKESKHRLVVDARDLAEALLMVYEKTEANGRYICMSHAVKERDMVEMLKTKYPDLNYPIKFTDVDDEVDLSSGKLVQLGWSHRPLEETLVDAVESYREAGLLARK